MLHFVMLPELLAMQSADDHTSRSCSLQDAPQSLHCKSCGNARIQCWLVIRTWGFANEVLLRLRPGNLYLDILQIGYHDVRFLPSMVSLDASH